MKLIPRLIFSLLSNLTALLAAAYFVKGFEITVGFNELLTVAAVFTLINFFIKPVLKLIFSPIIFVTLGLGIIFVNAVVLYLLDFFSDYIKIVGILPLLYATLIIGAVNLIIGFFAKRLYNH